MNRIPPHDLDAEASVLGAMLESKEAIARASEILDPGDFYSDKNRRVFESIMRRFTAGEAADAVTVADALARDGAAGDKQEIRHHVLDLLETYPTAGAAASYAKVVADLATLRRVITACQEGIDVAYSQPDNIRDAVTDVEWAILNATRQDAATASPTRRLAEFLRDDSDDIERRGKERGLLGISSGLPKLDAYTHGWQPGQLIVVGAQSGHGKSTLLQCFATEASRGGKTVLFVSLEMSSTEIRRRMYAAESGVPHDTVLTGRLSSDEWYRLNSAMASMNGWNLEINARKAQTTTDIAADARRVAARHRGLDLLVVDYLQYVWPSDARVPREQQVGRIARELKDLAGQLECPLITASQLNDQINQREDKRPRMTDIRESKGIEHTSDVILFGYWPWRHDDEGRSRWDFELIIGKHRQGEPDAVISCAFDPTRYSIRQDVEASFGVPAA